MHTVSIFVFPGFELLDASGPASVFGAANSVLANHGKPPFYAVEMTSPAGGTVSSSCGVMVTTRALSRPGRPACGTFLVVGGDDDCLDAVIEAPPVQRWLASNAEAAGRFGSICTGAVILAALGIVDGRRVATHWEACRWLSDNHPAITVDADSIYVVDGKIWTSAGVTTGIDMVLAMIAGDLGAAVASEVARRLVIYARRPGHQSQFSTILRAQSGADSPFAELVEWMQQHLEHPLDVPELARRSGLSERSFYRKFQAVMGQTPAAFVESVRLDAARMLLTRGMSIKAVAKQVGLTPSVRLAKAFRRRFGVTPALFRETQAGL